MDLLGSNLVEQVLLREQQLQNLCLGPRLRLPPLTQSVPNPSLVVTFNYPLHLYPPELLRTPKTEAPKSTFNFNLPKPNCSYLLPAYPITNAKTEERKEEAKPITTTKPADGTTTAGTAVLPLQSLPSVVSFPSNLKNKTLEEVIISWNEELENLVSTFERQAVEIAQWDKKIIHNGEQIIALNDRVNKLETFQRQVDQSLSYVVAQQSELEGCLDAIEKELPAFSQAVTESSGVKPGVVDGERERIYESAETAQKQVIEVANSLSRMIFEINSAATDTLASEEGSAGRPLADVAQVLNSHLDTLQWIDLKVEELRKAAAAVSSQALKVSSDMERLNQ